MPKVNFQSLGLDKNADRFLNWCLENRLSLEMIQSREVFEIWQQKGEQGNAILSFNQKGVLLKINKNLFS